MQLCRTQISSTKQQEFKRQLEEFKQMPDVCYIYQSGYPTLAWRIQLIFQVEALHYYLSIIIYLVLLLLFLIENR